MRTDSGGRREGSSLAATEGTSARSRGRACACVRYGVLVLAEVRWEGGRGGGRADKGDCLGGGGLREIGEGGREDVLCVLSRMRDTHTNTHTHTHCARAQEISDSKWGGCQSILGESLRRPVHWLFGYLFC
jgi:hypothetical protein